jgi:hypothetical protein
MTIYLKRLITFIFIFNFVEHLIKLFSYQTKNIKVPLSREDY